MSIYAKKTPANKSVALTNAIDAKIEKSRLSPTFLDNRAEAAAQMKLLKGMSENPPIHAMPMIRDNRLSVQLTDMAGETAQLMKKPSEVYDGEKISDRQLRNYLKGEEIAAIRAKMSQIRTDPYYKTVEDFAAVLSNVEELGTVFQGLFELLPDDADSYRDNIHKITDLDLAIGPYLEKAATIEEFELDTEERTRAYEEAKFTGNTAAFIQWIGTKAASDDFSGLGTARKVMDKLLTKFPLRFESIKADIIATRDKKFFMKEDLEGHRVAAANKIKSVVEEHGLQHARGPVKFQITLAGQKVAVSEGLPLETSDDMDVEGFGAISKEAVSELGFIILHAGVGDVNSLNARKLQDSDQFAIVDTGGSFAGTDDSTQSYRSQRETNYKEFYDALGDFKAWLKKYDDLGQNPTG